MTFRFTPADGACNPASGRKSKVAMVSGGVYDVDEGWAAYICETVPGIDGAPSLLPIAPAASHPTASDRGALDAGPPTFAPHADPLSVGSATLSAGKSRKRRGA